MQIKFCGLRRKIDVEIAADLGINAIGLVFYQPSPRNISVKEALNLTSLMPPLVLRVGLFVNAPIKYVRSVFTSVGLNLVQLHGSESPDYCKKLNLPYLKVMHVTEKFDPLKEMLFYPGSTGFLLDTFKSGVPGGTGISFDWTKVPFGNSKIVLAGGLSYKNVKKAILETKIGAVDVSSGIEKSPGIKDPDKMTKFVNEVRGFSYE